MKSPLERPIEDVIFENKDIIHEKGFIVFNSIAHRQFELPSQKKIDIVTWEVLDDEMKLAIIEIKKDEVSGKSGVLQAYEYAAELTDIFFKETIIKTIYLNVILVGYELKDLSVLKFLTFQPDIYLYDFNTLSGFKFNQQTEGGTIVSKHEEIDNLLSLILQKH